MSLFNRSKFILTANAAKAGILYSLKPKDGTGDYGWARAGAGSRVKENGMVEFLANDTPKIDFSSGKPLLNVETSATNLKPDMNYIWSFSNEGVIVTLNAGVSPSGEKDASYFKLADTLNAGAKMFGSNMPVTSGLQYTLSFWVKSLSGTGQFNLRIDSELTVQLVNKTFTASTAWQRFDVTFTIDAGSTFLKAANCTYRNNTNNFGEFLIWGQQFEQNGARSSLIKTAGATVTRPADTPATINPITKGYLKSTEGTIVIDGTVYRYTADGNKETFLAGVSQGVVVEAPPTAFTLPVGLIEKVLMFDYPLTNAEITAL